MLPVETLKLLQETALKANAQAARVLKVPAEPEHVYHLVEADGSIVRKEADLPPREHAAYDLTAVAAKMHLADEELAEVWYSRLKVVGVFGSDLRDLVTLDLQPSPQFAKLIEWDQHRGLLGQVEFVLLLRTLFADCLTSHESLRTDVSRVDFKKAQEASGTVSRANVSMSKAMIAEASGAEKLPEVLNFYVPVFDNPKLPFKANVKVVFDLDPQQEKFRLIPQAGEVETAWSLAETFLATQLQTLLTKEEDEGGTKLVCPLFYGEP